MANSDGKKDDMSNVGGLRRLIPVPEETKDYKILMGENGLGLYANRTIKKGRVVFDHSNEFLFSDVQDGDCLLLRNSNTNNTDNDDNNRVPDQFLLSRDVLMRTHGVPCLIPDPTGETAGTISFHLEAPVMLMNHSCEPNVISTSMLESIGEDITVNKIKIGEELTYNYLLQYYDVGPFFEECRCGSSKCRGEMMGFKSLTDKEKDELFPFASAAVQAMHRADTGQGPPVKREQKSFPLRKVPISSSETSSPPLQVVFPGPSNALASISVKKINNSSGEYGIFAMKDFKFGDEVYEFWCQDWPLDGQTSIDMICSQKLGEGDLEEGTVIPNLNPYKCSYQDHSGNFQFSGWDLLTAHSCNPNIYYTHTEKQEGKNWRSAWAAKDIKKGDQLNVDFNSFVMDRSSYCDEYDITTCNCKSTKCTGTMKGFEFLSTEEQNERWLMSNRRVLPPYDGEAEVSELGMALSPRCRACWKRN